MNDLNQLLREIKTEMQSFELNSDIHEDKGNKAAGARARKASLALTKLFKEYRKLSVKN